MAKVNPRYRLALNKELKRCLTHWFSVKPVHITQYLNASVHLSGISCLLREAATLMLTHSSSHRSTSHHRHQHELTRKNQHCFSAETWILTTFTLTEISYVHRKVPKTTLSNKNPFERLTSKMERVGKTSTPEFIFNNYLVTF